MLTDPPPTRRMAVDPPRCDTGKAGYYERSNRNPRMVKGRIPCDLQRAMSSVCDINEPVFAEWNSGEFPLGIRHIRTDLAYSRIWFSRAVADICDFAVAATRKPRNHQGNGSRSPDSMQFLGIIYLATRAAPGAR